jgi:lipopolysaccharide export system protein LptA
LLWHPLALIATAALAQQKQQQPVSALKGHDRNAPVDVSADRIEVQGPRRPGDFRGQCPRQTGRTDRSTLRGSPSLIRARAVFRSAASTPPEESWFEVRRKPARGEFGVYDLDRRLITLIGDVQLNRGTNQVNGSRLVIDLDSGRCSDRRRACGP